MMMAETPIQELSKFIKIFSCYSKRYIPDGKSELSVNPILIKFKTIFELTLNIHNDLCEIAKNGGFQFLIILLSNDKIAYEDNGELINIVLNFHSNMLNGHSTHGTLSENKNDIIKLRTQLIILLLKINSNVYQHKFDVICNIFKNKKLTKKFLCYLNNPIDPIVINTLFYYGIKRHTYEWICNIKLNWLHNLPIDTIYNVIMGSMRCIRYTVCVNNKYLIERNSAHSILEYIFNMYQLSDIPVDIIIKCFYKDHDINIYTDASKYPNFLAYRNKVDLLISKMEKTNSPKLYDICCILINLDCMDIVHNLLGSSTSNIIKQYFIKAIENILSPHLISSFIVLYPQMYFTQKDVYEKIDILATHIIDYNKNTHKYNYRDMMVAVDQSTQIICKMLSHIDKPITLISFDILFKLTEHNLYDILRELSEISVICTNNETNLVIDNMITYGKMLPFIYNISSNGKYIKYFTFTYKEKKIIIKFIDPTLYLLTCNLFEIHYLPADISNYVNILSYN